MEGDDGKYEGVKCEGVEGDDGKCEGVEGDDGKCEGVEGDDGKCEGVEGDGEVASALVHVSPNSSNETSYKV